MCKIKLEDIPCVELPLYVHLNKALVLTGLATSITESNRYIQCGAVKIDNEKIIKDNFVITKDEYILQVGKRRFTKVVTKDYKLEDENWFIEDIHYDEEMLGISANRTDGTVHHCFAGVSYKDGCGNILEEGKEKATLISYTPNMYKVLKNIIRRAYEINSEDTDWDSIEQAQNLLDKIEKR